jgi:hypothetical protein
VRNFKSISAAGLALLILVLAAQADVAVTLHDGSEIRTKSVTYEKKKLKLANGKTISRSLVKQVTQIHEQSKSTQSSPTVNKDVKALLASAGDSVKRFPNAKSILLVDYGYEEKRADGTWLFRYRSATKILHPDKLALASQSLYFDERRNARIIQAR